MNEALDPYAVLGVSPSATPAEITHAYRQRLRAQHPDTRTGPRGSTAAADDEVRQVLAAYALLRDPARRADYDRTLRRDTQPRAVVTTARGATESVEIPVTRNARRRIDPAGTPPLWAGPVRRHR